MPRTAISGLVCTTFLVLLVFPAVPQEPAGKDADTEAGQLTFNNACRTCHTTKEGDNRLGPNLHNIIGRKAGSLQTMAILAPWRARTLYGTRRSSIASSRNPMRSCPATI
jgi:Cytochrome c